MCNSKSIFAGYLIPNPVRTHTHTHTHIYIYIYISSSSSCRMISTNKPDPLSSHLSFIHCFQQVFRPTSCIGTKRLYVGSSSHPAFARPCEGVHRSTSLMISYLLLQQCPECLIRLILIAFMMVGRWPYSCYFLGCCLEDLFNIAHIILM